jgi:glutamate racemase
MTIQIIESLIKLSVAAVIVAFALLLFVLQSRYTLPVIGIAAIVFAVYGASRILRKGILKLR